MPKYTVKNVKTFRGMEGEGYNATLYRDGKKVCEVIDDASGGEVNFQWADAFKKIDGPSVRGERVEIHGFNYKDEPYTYKGTPEEKLFVEHVNVLTYKCPFTGTYSRMSRDIFIAQLIDGIAIERECKKNIVVTVEGEDGYTIFKLPFNAGNAVRVAAKMEKEGKKITEWVNHRYASAVGQ